MTTDQMVNWMGHTVTAEYLALLRSQGLNPWLTIISGRALPARPNGE